MNTTPVSVSERSDVLDILRGFAILGIFIANSAGFSLYNFLKDEQQAALPTYYTDRWLHYLTAAFVEGKFYSLFSLLFGIGFTIMLDKNKNPGRAGLLVFYRRLCFLVLIGLAHLLLFWDGDILLLYALVGMMLPLFRRLSNKKIILIAIVLIFSPLLFDTVKIISQGRWNLAKPFEAMAIATDSKNGITEQNYHTYLVEQTGYESILRWNQGGFFWRYQHILDSNRIPKVLAMFLLGVVAGRKKIYSRLEENKIVLQKVQKWGFLIGIPASLAFAYFELDHRALPKMIGLADTFFYATSVIPLSLAYTASICILWLIPSWKAKLKILAPVGRMALTNYLMQTIIAIMIYYGFGFGLGAKFGPTGFIPIAFMVYAAQVIFSNYYFRYFRYGPVEWIWRQLTYRQRLPIRNEMSF